MAILNRDEYFAQLQARVGTDTSDEGIEFLENMTDTYNALEQQANADNINWEQRYHELDESWKARYRHRFFSGGTGGNPNGKIEDEPEDKYNPDNIGFDDLFK